MEDRAALQTWGPDGVLLWPCRDFSSREACAVSDLEAGEGEENNEKKQKTKKKDESRAKLRYKMLSYYYFDADHALITLSNRLLETVPKYLLVR